MGVSRYDDSDRLQFLIDRPQLTVMREEATVYADLAFGRNRDHTFDAPVRGVFLHSQRYLTERV
mgnify:CR=1 FL=1